MIVLPCVPGFLSSHRPAAAAAAQLPSLRSDKTPLAFVLRTASQDLRSDLTPLAFVPCTASQDLRPPGPVPPDATPFRQAWSADGRRPLCTFFLPPAHLAGGGDRDGDGDGKTAKAGENGVPGNKSNDAAVAQVGKVGRKARVKTAAREGEVATSGGSQPSTYAGKGEVAEGAAGRRGGDLGRAFGHPAADSSPTATHVINFIEDNPDLAWRSSALRAPRRRSVQHPGHARGDDQDSEHGGATSASESEAGGRKSAKGKRQRNPEDEDGDEESAGLFARMRSKWRGGGDKQGGTETAVAAGATVAAGERLLEEATAPVASAAAVLPDVVGAGGFAEFIPLLDTVFGR